MKKSMKIIGVYLLPFIILTSCGGSNDPTKKAEPINRDTVAVNKSDTLVKEEVREKAEVVSAKLNYIENTILEDGTFKQESILKNGEDIFLNGCSQYELKKLSFKGTGSNLTLRIGKHFKKEGLDLSEGITITNKDTKEIETIEILDGKKSIFKVTVSNSGCN